MNRTGHDHTPQIDVCTAMHYIAVMDDQLTVRLSTDLSKALKERAARMQRKPSEVVRMAIAEFLQETDTPDAPPAERVKHLLGSLETGIPDLAQRHRHYVLKRLRRGR